MSTEKSHVKVFVFIARDKAEYDKYFLEDPSNDTSGARSDSPENGRSQWCFSSKSSILRAVVEKGCLGPSGWELLQPYSNGSKGSRLSDILDALRKDSKDGEAISTVKEKVEILFNSNLIKEFLRNLKGVDGKKILGNDDVQYRFFIHWGGGEREKVLFYEREVSKRLQKSYLNARLYSLGTNRNDIFNVDRLKIVIPSKSEELDELDEQFYNEQRFAGAMSDEPLSLVASCARENVAAKQGILITKRERYAVFLRIEDLKDRILTPSLETQVKNELLIEIAAARNDFISSETDGDSDEKVEILVGEKTVKLARKILNKEVFNG